MAKEQVTTTTIDKLVPDDKNFNKGTEYGKQLLGKSFGQFGAGRSILIDKNNRIIAGNKATEEYGEQGGEKVIVVETDGKTLVAVKRTDIDLDSKRGRELALADNATQRADLDWDTEVIEAVSKEWEIDAKEWGVNMPEERKGWRKGLGYTEPLCDMKEEFAVHKCGEYMYISAFRTTEEGIPLTTIKETDENIPAFADAYEKMIRKVYGLQDATEYCIVTAPQRRHKGEENFATKVCSLLSQRLEIPFYNAFSCKNKNRINPEFQLDTEIKEKNIIFIDDILTTGSTLKACCSILQGKNVSCLIGINNH